MLAKHSSCGLKDINVLTMDEDERPLAEDLEWAIILNIIERL